VVRELREPGDHQDKEIRKVLKEIVKASPGRPSFQLVKGGHWGMLECSNGCCQIGVWGTPKNAVNHARDLRREVAKCPRKDGDVRKRQARKRPE
jgi:hypothetical protein